MQRILSPFRFPHFILIFCFFLSYKTSCLAWCQFTHIYINQLAYEKAKTCLGDEFCIPPILSQVFIETGPGPDFRELCEDEFPGEFHSKREFNDFLIDFAKTDERFDLEDVVGAIGWASHYYSEYKTAHAENKEGNRCGFSDGKKIFFTPGSRKANHSINELIVDILLYHEFKDRLINRSMRIPFAVLESAMQQKKSVLGKTMKKRELRKVFLRYLLVPIGIRILTEFLETENPELLTEMNDCYPERVSAIESSVQEVLNLLSEKARKDFSKPVSRLPSFAFQNLRKIKLDYLGFGNDSLTEILRSGLIQDFLVAYSIKSLQFLLHNPIFRNLTEKMIEKLAEKWSGGDAKNRRIFSRFLRALTSPDKKNLKDIIIFSQNDL